MTRMWRNVVVAAPPAVRVPADIATLPLASQVVELRLDLLHATAPDVVQGWIDAVHAWDRLVLLTLRSVDEGGAFAGSAAEAAAVLSRHAPDVWRVDGEPGVQPLLTCANVLHSTHSDLRASRPPDSRHAEPADAALAEGALRKVARRIDDAAAWAALLADARTAPAGTTWVPFGGLACTRTLFAGWGGNTLLFGAADHDSGVVAGQPTLGALLDELRVGEVGPHATLFGLVGNPPAWSPSPAMHNAVFRHEARDALYVPFPGMSLRDVCALPVHAVSVTAPYKAQAYSMATSRSATAQATGAVNTLVRTDAGWHGANTDAEAFAALAPPAQRGDSALVYGAGATARSAIVGLQQQGYEVRVAARRPAAARATAGLHGVAADPSDPTRQERDRVVVNATPVGATAPLPAWVGAFGWKGLLLIDAPYRQGAPTDWVALAVSQAARVHDGLAVLTAQALGQARAFGATAEDATLQAILTQAVRPSRSLWLIGPRGVGKSTIGAAVAARLGRPFVDLDHEIARRSGRSVGDLIDQAGWLAFRDAEVRAVEGLMQRSGIVVATGGGVVERPENQIAPAVGHVVWLDAPPDVVVSRRGAHDTRPVLSHASSVANETRQLDTTRRPIYERWSHGRVDATQSVEAVVTDVLRGWSIQAAHR